MSLTLFRNVLCGTLAMVCIARIADAQSENASSNGKLEESVVKVFATMRSPDPTKPWTKQAPRDVTGSGVVIDGNRILTNAHVVLYANQLQVQANQSGDKLSASVIAVAPGIDLALLKLDDEAFFKTHPPMPRANTLPQIKDEVLAYGYPVGGSSMSITKGIVSRIEFVAYNYPTSGLRIQVDAAINPGNSGGPAVAGDRMIGLTFSTLNNSQNIGYIIPNEEIELFLKDIADGHYDGKPAMFDELQTLENPALRSYLKLDKSIEGMVVHNPYRSDASYPLKEWDVITHIGTTPVDDQGMVKLGDTLRVNFRYLVQQASANGKLPLTIIRAGKTMQLQLPVSPERPLLLADLRGDYPPYFIYGPLVFTKATLQYFSLFANNASALNALSFIGNPLITQRGASPTPEREELVIVAAPLFPHKLSKGYGNPPAGCVYAVNGVKIRSLKHLVTVLRDLKDEFVTFEFEQRGGETLVFPRKEMVQATEEILTDNGVRTQGSPDMMEVWDKKRK